MIPQICIFPTEFHDWKYTLFIVASLEKQICLKRAIQSTILIYIMQLPHFQDIPNEKRRTVIKNNNMGHIYKHA
jgi:hypothetical protein